MGGDPQRTRTARCPRDHELAPGPRGPITCSGETPWTLSPRWTPAELGARGEPEPPSRPPGRTRPGRCVLEERRSRRPRPRCETGTARSGSRRARARRPARARPAAARSGPGRPRAARAPSSCLQPRRAVDRQRPLAPAQVERLQQPRQPEPVVGVEVGEEHLVEVGQPDRADELALGALAAVEQDPLAAAAHEQRRAARGARSGSSRRCRRRTPRGPSTGQCVSRAAMQLERSSSPSRTLAIPIVCRGARRRSVGLPGLKI